MKKSMDSIMTAAPVLALNQDKAVLPNYVLVDRNEDAEVGMWWVLYESGEAVFMSEREYLMEAMNQ